MQWTTRIKTKMKELGITQEELASKMGITRGAITHYLAGRRVPPLRQFQKLAVVLKTDPAWLQFGTSIENAKVSKKSSKKNELEQTFRYPIPILSWEQAAKSNDVTKHDQDQIKEYLPHFYINKNRWFALRVKSDSMVSQIGVKSFHEGDVIIVDPDKEASNGSFVIALLPRCKEFTFRQYVVDSGVRYLKPLNTHYPLIEIDKNVHICGVVINRINQF